MKNLHAHSTANPFSDTSTSSIPNTKTLIIIAGPTAVGKTAVAIQVAQHFNTVILSADSRQCFKELNIGVARPTGDELKTIPHYFIASHSVHEKIDAAYYEKYALGLLQNLFSKYEVIVATGGTGLYIKALVEGLDEMPEIPEAIRQTIINNYKSKGINWLQEELNNKDILFSAEGEMQNPQRMMRALEVLETTGKSIMNFRTQGKAKRDFNILQIGLEMPRPQLYERINARVNAMMLAGLEQEALSLKQYSHLNALQTVGYKEMFDYFEGNISKESAIELIKQNTRHYAKRQMTWFKKQQGMHWINVCEDIVRFIEMLLAMS